MYHYFMLKEFDQVIAFTRNGVYLDSFNSDKTTYRLFSLSTFFIELEQDNATKKMVGRQIFKSEAQLEKYLPDLQLTI